MFQLLCIAILFAFALYILRSRMPRLARGAIIAALATFAAIWLFLIALHFREGADRSRDAEFHAVRPPP